jgi:hypothetical protein
VTVLVPGGTFAAPAKRITGLAFGSELLLATIEWVYDESENATARRFWRLRVLADAYLFPVSPEGTGKDASWTYGGTTYTSSAYTPWSSNYGQITYSNQGSGKGSLTVPCDGGDRDFEYALEWYAFTYATADSSSSDPFPWPDNEFPDSFTLDGQSFTLSGGMPCVVTDIYDLGSPVHIDRYGYAYYTKGATITPSIYVEMVWVSTFSGERRFIIQCYVDQNLIAGDPTGTGLTSSWVVDGTGYDGADYVKTNATFAKVQTYTHPTQIGSYDSVVDTDSGDVTYSRPYSFHVYESDHGNNVVSGLDPYPWAGTSAPSSFVIDGTSFSLKAGSWSVKTSLLAPNERYDTYAVYELT